MLGEGSTKSSQSFDLLTYYSLPQASEGRKRGAGAQSLRGGGSTPLVPYVSEKRLYLRETSS
jgi:hypothetical protein